MPNAFIEYFRCPPDHARFEVAGPLSADEGFFTFQGVVCYGQGTRPGCPDAGPNVPDLSNDVATGPNGVRLPFDLSSIAVNLWHERYHKNSQTLVSSASASGPSQAVYYFLRPMLPVAVRKHLQRIRLSGWQRIRFPHWPVDVTVDTLMERAMSMAIARAGGRPVPFIWFWPDGATGAAILTHDVESPAGLEFCQRLMDLDDTAGLKASFQLVPEIRYQTSRRVFDMLRERGFEGNVHDLNHDGHLFRNREQFTERAVQINRYAHEFGARGFRAACMYREQSWFEALDVAYDMSVPNVAHLEPQRGGCCTVMPYFTGDIVELPLTTVQDYSLFHILNDYSIELWKQQVDAILAHHGLVTILTHPDYLIEHRARVVYCQLLQYLRRTYDERRVWSALPGDVERWWRNRSRMRLVQDDAGWRVEGPDSDRARVAYAAVEHDRVVYRMH